MTTAVVVGGGLAGLSASYYLRKSSKFAKVILVEASQRCGGWVQTDRYHDGTVFDIGPRSCRMAMNMSSMNMLYLANQLGLADKVLSISNRDPAAKNRFLYVNGQMHPVKMKFLSRSPPFKHSMMWVAIRDWSATKSNSPDETIHDFISRRLGTDFAELGISTVIRGIMAGDSRKLSMKSCFPEFFNGERKYGTLRKSAQRMIKGHKLELKKEKNRYLLECQLIDRALSEKWAMFSFENGYQQIVDSLESYLTSADVEVLKGTPCRSLKHVGDKMLVELDENTIAADHVVSATYSKDLASLLPENHSPLSDYLNRIPAVTVALASIELPGNYHPNPAGFGHLVPMTEDAKILGVIYDSSMFKNHDRAEEQTTRFTMMMGGAWFDELEAAVGEITLPKLKELALSTLLKHLNLAHVEPSKIRVHVLQNCIPQYMLGHSDLLDNIDGYVSEAKMPLSLVGASYRGVSTSDVVYNSKLEIQRLTGVELK